MPSRPTPRSVPRSTAPRHALMLDPHGIYGTRTANRLRSSRRRRQSQNFVALIALVALCASVAAWAKMHRVTAQKPDAELELLSPCAAAPVEALDEKTKTSTILLPTADGRLLVFPRDFSAQTKPEVALDTAFALHVPLLKNQIAFVPCEDGVLYALDWKARKVLWRYGFHAPLGARPVLLSLASPTPPKPVASTPAASDNEPSTPPAPAVAANAPREIVVAGADDGLLIALDAKSGQPVWKSRVPSPVGDAIIVLQNPPRILVPLLGNSMMRGGLWCLDGATGKVLWRFPKSGREEAIQSAAPVVDENAGRVFFGSETGALFCLDLKTGTYDAKKKIGWKTFAAPMLKNSDAAISWRTAPLLIFGGEREGASTRLIAGASDGVVRCYATQNGALLWQFNADAPVENLQKIARAGETQILIATQSGALLLLDGQSGALLKTLAGAQNLGGALALDGEVLGVSADGQFQRFDLND